MPRAQKCGAKNFGLHEIIKGPGTHVFLLLGMGIGVAARGSRRRPAAPYHGCHGIEKDGTAHLHPLWGVLGRDKASVEGVRYSEAFHRLVGKWTLAELNAFIASPLDHVPGTEMRVKGLRDPMERANLIAFLLQNSDDPPPLPPRP